MARGTPIFFSGTLPSRPAGGQVTQIRAELDTRLTAYQSNSGDAWEAYDTIDASADNLDVTYRSLGDRTLVSGAGDAALYINIDKFGADDIEFTAYQDWSDLSSTGSRAAGGSNARWQNVNDYSECAFWGASNEYEFCFLMYQAQMWYWVHFGSPVRSHLAPTTRGVAFTTASVSSGSSVTVNLDRDLTSTLLDSGDTGGPQNVWIYNITPTSTALRSNTVEIAEVETIASGSITFASLSNSFSAGAIVGYDPCPMFVAEFDGNAPGGNADATLYFTNNVSGGYNSQSQQIADYEAASSVLAGDIEPNGAGALPGSKALINMDQLNQVGFRGVSDLLALVRSGSLTDQDFWRPDFSVSDQYMTFPSVRIGDLNYAIGPGAT